MTFISLKDFKRVLYFRQVYFIHIPWLDFSTDHLIGFFFFLNKQIAWNVTKNGHVGSSRIFYSSVFIAKPPPTKENLRVGFAL